MSTERSTERSTEQPAEQPMGRSTLTGTIARRIVELGIAAEVGATLVDASGARRFAAATHGRAATLVHLQVALGEGPSADCCTTGLPVTAPDLALMHVRWPSFAPAACAAGLRSAESVPLRLRGTLLGTIDLLLDTPGGVAPGALHVVRALTDVVVIALEQQRELDRARDVAAQLEHALHSRVVIEQAKGMLSEQAGITVDAAFELLRRRARDLNRRLAAIAGDVVGRRLDAADLVASHRIRPGAAPAHSGPERAPAA